MAIARIHTWAAGEVLTATDLNNEFNNILSNSTALITPLTANLAFGGFSLTGLALGSASTPSLSFDGDTNTGLYSSGADSVDLVGRGVRVLQASSYDDAVNWLRIVPSKTGQAVKVEAAGSDTNLGMELVTKGTGYVQATSFRFGVFSATQVADHEGRVYWHKGEQTLHIVAGTLMARVPAITSIRAGDIFFATGTDGATTFARLSIGLDGQTLGIAAGLPAWGGGGVTVLAQLATTYGVTDSTAEVEIFNCSIPAGTLSDHNRVEIEINGFQQITSNVITFRLKYGGSTIVTVVPTAATVAASSYAVLRGGIGANAVSNNQRGWLEAFISDGAVERLHAAARGSATVDSSVAQQLVLTAQPSTQAATNNFTREHAIARAWTS